MKLESIKLTNFRCYKELDVELHPNVTVLVADNGQGKTTVLDAIRIALWPYVSGFDLAKSAYNDRANTITVDDAKLTPSNDGKMVRQLPSRIEVTGVYKDQKDAWCRLRESDAKRSQTKDDSGTAALKKWSKSLQQKLRTPNTSFNLPVFGYYGTGRLWKEKRLTASKKGRSKTKTELTNEQINTFAYRDCLDPASSYKQFEDWYTSAFLKMRESQITKIESGASDLRADEELQNPIDVIQSATNALLKESGWHNVAYSQKHNKSLVLSHKDKGILKVDQLSDGIKNMLAMVADIAYRCSHLNRHLGRNAAKESHGIVLIDEVDMHLHPKWQQTVIQGLRDAFPNIQFVVTTHSPQVLSTVPAESIRLLKHTTDPETGEAISIAEQPETQSRGVASSSVMANLMGVDPTPNVKEARLLSRYKALIQQNLHERDDGRALRNELDDHFGSNHQEMLECDRMIRFQAIKNKLPIKKSASDSKKPE